MSAPQMGLASIFLSALAIVATACGTSSSATPSTVTAPSNPAPRLSAKLVLDAASVKAGGSIKGHVEVVNNSGHAIGVSGCGNIFQVLLTNPDYRPSAYWAACLQHFTIPVGTSQYPAVVEASYNHCNPGGASDGVPACSGHGAPPLPPGTYKAKTFESGAAIPIPAEVTVQVTG